MIVIKGHLRVYNDDFEVNNANIETDKRGIICLAPNYLTGPPPFFYGVAIDKKKLLWYFVKQFFESNYYP
jgi:hypothetical protein